MAHLPLQWDNSSISIFKATNKEVDMQAPVVWDHTTGACMSTSLFLASIFDTRTGGF